MSSLRSLIPFTPATTSTHAGINNCTPQLYLGLCCMHDVGSSVVITLGQIAARTAQPAVYAHVHILADHVTLSIG